MYWQPVIQGGGLSHIFRCLKKSLPHKNSAVYVENGSIVKSHTWVDDLDSELIHGVYSLLLWSI